MPRGCTVDSETHFDLRKGHLPGAPVPSLSGRARRFAVTNRDGTSQFGRSQGRAPVEIDGRPIFLVQTSVGGLSLEERAESVNTDRLGGLRGLFNG